MIRINLIIAQLLLFCGAIPGFSQEPEKITTTNYVDITSGSVSSSEDELATSKSHSTEVSERMVKKMREMEKITAEVRSQDDAALETIGGKLEKTIDSLPFNKDLIAAIKDKRFDWHIRYLLVACKSHGASESELNRYAEDFAGIMLDKDENNRVRAVAARMLLEVSEDNAKVKEAISAVAKSTDTPAEVLQVVMAVAGSSGMDDADVLMKLTERGPANINDVGINLNAVRALGKSKDPRAIGYLIKIFDESVPDSFYQVTAIQQFSDMINDPATKALAKPLIIPRFLKLLDDRSYLGASRDEAVAVLAKMDVKEAVDPILRWFLPAKETHAVEGGGGNRMDVYSGADALVKLGNKRAIPVLEQTINNFANDSRWSWGKDEMRRRGFKFPDDHQDYKHLKECLAALKKQK